MCKRVKYFGLAICLVFLSSFQVDAKRKLTLRNLEKVREDNKDFQSQVQLTEPDAEGHIKLNGELKQHVTVDNNWKVNITMQRKSKLDDQYVTYLDVPVMGVCLVMSSYYRTMIYEKLKNYSNAPHPDKCPLPPDQYHLKDYPLDASRFKKYLNRGYYLINGQLLKDNQIKMEYQAELQVE